MAGQDTDRLPEDPSALAECVKNCIALQDAALRRLAPTLRQIASVAASKCSLYETDRANFKDEAPSLFFRRCKRYDPRRGKVEAWWYRVCINAAWDIQRGHVRRPTVPLPPNHVHIEQVAGYQEALEQALDQSVPFSLQDVEQIALWSLQNRIVLMCLTGLWKSVPQDKWKEWCGEFGLPDPFPPKEFAELSNRSERTRELARLLGISIPTLTQIWHRGLKLLIRLEYWERWR